MKLEVGMYVRDDYFGIIRKIYSIDKKRKKIIYDEKNGFEMFFSQVKTASYNLIDLIEVGDYINGYLVTTASDNTGSIYIDLKDNNGLRTKLYNKDIQTILTKEQYENNCYKVIEK